jgi:hypothetical protein
MYAAGARDVLDGGTVQRSERTAKEWLFFPLNEAP